MANDITNGMLLEHMQGMKGELLGRIDGLQQQIANLNVKVDKGFAEAGRQFEEARQHRQALQEDLDASIRMVGKHDKKLSRL